MGQHRITLASTSPWRARLLRSVGLHVEAVAPEVDESTISAGSPRALAEARAVAKAAAVARVRPGALVIGADQVAHQAGAVFGKPRDPEDWLRRLHALRGRWHTLSTGVAMVDADGAVTSVVDDVQVRFRDDLSDDELRAYVELGEAAGCAGGYMAEARGAWFVAEVQGEWSAVQGLPMSRVVSWLRAQGWGMTADGPRRRRG